MKKFDMNVFDFVPEIFKKEQYAACYNSSIYPANGQQLWQRTEYTDLQPPPIKKLPGRPKKRRNKDANELLDKSQLKRARWGIRCSRCKQSGHNKSTCKLPPPPSQPSSSENPTSTQGTSVQNPQPTRVTLSRQGRTKQPPPPEGSSQQHNPTGAASARTSNQQKRTSKRKGKEKVSSTQPGANREKKKVSARARGSTSSQH
jgi:hypothetical protein